MRAERGFIQLSLMGYIALAAGAVIIGLLLAVKIQSARLDSAKAELEACASRYAETLKNVNLANKRVDDLAKDAEKRARIAAAALAKAREGQGKADSEIARLRSVKPADCAAAVATVKAGLKP